MKRYATFIFEQEVLQQLYIYVCILYGRNMCEEIPCKERRRSHTGGVAIWIYHCISDEFGSANKSFNRKQNHIFQSRPYKFCHKQLLLFLAQTPVIVSSRFLSWEHNSSITIAVNKKCHIEKCHFSSNLQRTTSIVTFILNEFKVWSIFSLTCRITIENGTR